MPAYELLWQLEFKLAASSSTASRNPLTSQAGHAAAEISGRFAVRWIEAT